MSSDRRFTGRQLTVIVVALCATVVLTPVGVMASSHTIVSIGDGRHPSQTAAVTKAGAQVVTGAVRLTGTSAVKGTVSTKPGLPGTPYSVTVNTLDTNSQTVPAGKSFLVTSVSAEVAVDAGANVRAFVINDANDAELLQVPLVKAGQFSTADLYNASFATNVIVPSGMKIAAFGQTSDSSDSNGQVILYGYLV